MPSSRPPSPRQSPSGQSRGGRPRRPAANTRPAQRSASTRAQAVPAGRPRARFTSRMAVITVVLAVLVVSYASSMKAYLQQRGQINSLTSQIAQSRTDIAALQQEKKRWNDPAYVKDQATRRFGWVLPGEVAYEVIDRNGKPMGTSNQLSDPNRVVHQTPTAWWARQADSLAKADHPPKAPVPPKSKITPKDE